jgi:putative iron-dependent peroxidase
VGLQARAAGGVIEVELILARLSSIVGLHMVHPQDAILAPLPPAGRFLSFGLRAGADAPGLVARLAHARVVDGSVIGIGAPLVAAVGATLEGAARAPGPDRLWRAGPPRRRARCGRSSEGSTKVCWSTRRARSWSWSATTSCSTRTSRPSSTKGGRDLTGYEDGTENPVAERARETALVTSRGPGIDGGSFVSVQRWVHDLARFERKTPAERDHIVGRSRATNEELDEAPPSAHVKRAAQESFDPPSFLVRRSMPFGDAREQGLVFVAYASSLDPFERILRRMVGHDDGIVDGLFSFSRPVTSAAYFCPPLVRGHLDLTTLLR